MSLASLPVWLGATIFVVLTCALSLLFYAIARRLLARRTSDDTGRLADSVVFRIGALHSLILALVFAQEEVNYASLHETVSTEVAAIGDIFYDLARYDAEANRPLQEQVVGYVEIVAETEWSALAAGGLSTDAWIAWDSVYVGVLDLEPQSGRQTSLRDSLLRDLDIISDSRNDRELAAIESVTDIFWFAAIFGLILVVTSYFNFKPSPINLALLTGFAAYNGLILFFIAAMNNPFADPAALQPTAFERLGQELRSDLPGTS